MKIKENDIVNIALDIFKSYFKCLSYYKFYLQKSIALFHNEHQMVTITCRLKMLHVPLDIGQ